MKEALNKSREILSRNSLQILEMTIKGSQDPSHFIFEINIGKRRIRHGTTLNLNDTIFNRLGVDLEIHHSISVSLFIGSDSFRH